MPQNLKNTTALLSSFALSLGATAVAGPGAVVAPVLASIFGNIAASRLEAIDTDEFKNWFLDKSPDVPNHDLFKAYRNAILVALDNIYEKYEIEFRGIYRNAEGIGNWAEEKYTNKHLKTVKERLEAIKEELTENFFKDHAEGITEADLKHFGDQQSPKLNRRNFNTPSF